MESRQVRHFLAAYDLGTFVAAADQLGLSQQAISKSIQRLELQLGVQLFERDGRRVRPTRYADMFVPHARTIAAEAARFRADLDDMLGGRRGRLRVGIGPSAAASVVATASKSMAAKQPGIKMSAMAGLYETLINDLMLGALDMVVALRQVTRDNKMVREERLGDVRYAVVAGVGHPLAAAKGLTLTDLKDEIWISGSNIGEVEQNIEDSFRAVGMTRRRIDIETTSILFSLSMLDSTTHIAILPELLVQRDCEAGRLILLDVDTSAWTRPLILATRMRGANIPLVQIFTDELRQACAGLNPGAGPEISLKRG